jgi:cytochrome c peroxidase
MPGKTCVRAGFGFAIAVLAACSGGGETPENIDADAAPPPTLSTNQQITLSAPAGVDARFQTLSGVVPPDPSGMENGQPVTLNDYVKDRAATVRLGKALFWDMNLGSDGNTACASCHYHAGADKRIKNQIDPGMGHVYAVLGAQFNKPFVADGVPGDLPSTTTKSGGKGGPNYTLKLADFPTYLLANPLDRNSVIAYASDDVIGSQGVFDANFVRAGQSRFDDCDLRADTVFSVGNLNTRRVTARNSPTVINAALNVRNFWDGRANNTFNGFSPFGPRDPDAGIWVTQAAGLSPVKVKLALSDASAASQAVGPPGSDIEMSCGGRSFANIARRVLDQPALNRQAIDAQDSVLRAFTGAAKPKYRALIQAAFQPRLWNATQQVSLGGQLYSQIEANFPLFFELAIQLYESTLISSQAPLDAYLQGDTTALDAQEIRGMQIFAGKGQCINCHGGPELTNAATRLRLSPKQGIERMLMADSNVALYDNGFYNIGVRPAVEDLGVGAADPWGKPLSFTRQYRTRVQGSAAPDQFAVDVCAFEVKLSDVQLCNPTLIPALDFRDAVDGAFKTPGLRNIALTGPYFHNGSRATLEQVVEFYNRGGDARGSDTDNTTRYGVNTSNLDADIKPLGFTAQEAADLVAFLKRPLTDPRVAWERAPFDHPSLVITHGHNGDETRVAGQQSADPKFAKRAQDVNLNIKAIGAGGRSTKEGALQPFHTGLN